MNKELEVLLCGTDVEFKKLLEKLNAKEKNQSRGNDFLQRQS